ncbi:A. THALIANA PECTIN METHYLESTERASE 31, pectin methylesterase 31 [Hibiscus trionum]|uniref:pectinesterase n=1 Tax=Hibiscus trionum TaxID=183268 RepID=A0A9W7H029_HIBTR|nr:A. THALIANA PECTIN METHYLESTERASE 31, pectin methylesterase 31 [Hibiscus trionum]
MAEPKVITVSQDGSADHKTLQEAVDAVEPKSKTRTIIRLSPGIYKQPVYVPKDRHLITLLGVRAELTIITWDNTAAKIDHHLDESLIGKGTFACGSMIVEGDDFIAENVTFENNAPEGSHQAVAIRVTGDRCAFYSCRFLGWQDTLYLHRGKSYLRDCYIEGNVDYIFGNSTTLFEHCHLHCKSPGFVTAHKRGTADETTGYVFLRCVLTGNGEPGYAYLGRPWGPFGRVLFAYTYIDKCIKNEGWHNWEDPEKEKTACFYEFKCFGPGAHRNERVAWSKELNDQEAEEFLVHKFIDTDPNNSWLAQKMGHRVPVNA